MPRKLFVLPGKWRGLSVKGNINLLDRQPVFNPFEGGWSSVFSMSFGTPYGEVLIPRAVNGKILSKQDAIAYYEKTKQHLGVFRTIAEAQRYAKKLHLQQQRYYKNYHAPFSGIGSSGGGGGGFG